MLYEFAKKIAPLRKLHTWYSLEKQALKWNSEVSEIKKGKSNFTISEKVLPKGKKMIILPHSDDEWVGCSQVIMEDDDLFLCDADMPGGDSLEMHALRKKEVKKTADFFQREIVTLSEANTLEEVVHRYCPLYIMLPFYMDWHPEHIKVMEMVAEIIDNMPSVKAIIMYQVSVPILPEFVTHVISLSKLAFRKKWAYFRSTYISQTTIPYRRFGCNERINGEFCCSYAAEVFRIVEKKQWLQELQVYRLSETEVVSIKKSLYSLVETRYYLEKLMIERKENEYRVDTTNL